MPPRPPERLLALPRDPLALRAVADQVFSRTAGAPLVGGNATRVLRDATENYPAWAEAIASARPRRSARGGILCGELAARRRPPG